MTDDLKLRVGGREISGWTGLRVTRGIERVPGSFDISLTERYPGEAEGLAMQPGDACQVLLGDDLVLTGYIDQYRISIAASTHTIRAIGRGKCADLVDCSAEWPGAQISGANALGIAKRLAKPYGISVSGESGAAVPQMILLYGETAWEIIERTCRFAALLAIEEPTGNLLLTHVGTEQAASGFVLGKNIEQAEAAFTMDQRYSEYWVYRQAANLYADVGGGPFIIQKLSDAQVPRHRRKAIVVDSGPQGSQDEYGARRAVWEMNRRAARSRSIALTVDSWRDSKGQLWRPNTLAKIEAKTLKLPGEQWVIGDVTYRRDNTGTHADITLMPANAFKPEPIVLMPMFPDVPFGIGREAR